MQFRSIYRTHHHPHQQYAAPTAAAVVSSPKGDLSMDVVPGGSGPGQSISIQKTRRDSATAPPSSAAGQVYARLSNALRMLYEWKTEHQFLGRYTVDKLVRFDQYCRETSRWRVAAVLALSPVPVVTIILAFQAVPLPDPAHGASRSWLLFVWSACAHATLTLAMLFPLKQAVRLTDSLFPVRTMAAIACFTGVVNELLFLIPVFSWRFPMPFRELYAGDDDDEHEVYCVTTNADSE